MIKKCQGIPRYWLYLHLDRTKDPSLQQLQISFIDNDQVAHILCVKREIVIKIMYIMIR